jgi:hypothetical protein
VGFGAGPDFLWIQGKGKASVEEGPVELHQEAVLGSPELQADLILDSPFDLSVRPIRRRVEATGLEDRIRPGKVGPRHEQVEVDEASEAEVVVVPPCEERPLEREHRNSVVLERLNNLEKPLEAMKIVDKRLFAPGPKRLVNVRGKFFLKRGEVMVHHRAHAVPRGLLQQKGPVKVPG